MNIEQTKKEIQVFIVNGKEFLTEKEAKEYVAKINEELKYTYFDVIYKPDLTEGRGYYDHITLAIASPYCAEQVALHYCFKKIGSPLEFVMGCQAMPNWILKNQGKFKTLEEIEKFKTQNVNRGIGDYVKWEPRKIIVVSVNSKWDIAENSASTTNV